MCDRIGIFAAGRLIGQGSLARLARTFGEESGELTVGVEADDGVDPDAVERRLAGVPGVARAARVATTRDREWTWHVRVAADVSEPQVRAALLAALAESNLRLADLARQPPSLEDIYRRAVEQARSEREVRAKAKAEARARAGRARDGRPSGGAGDDAMIAGEARDAVEPSGVERRSFGSRPSRVRSRRSLRRDPTPGFGPVTPPDTGSRPGTDAAEPRSTDGGQS